MGVARAARKAGRKVLAAAAAAVAIVALVGLALVASLFVCESRYPEQASRASALADTFVQAVERGAPLEGFTFESDGSTTALIAAASKHQSCEHVRVEWRDVSMFPGDGPHLLVRVYCRDGSMWRFGVKEAHSGNGFAIEP